MKTVKVTLESVEGVPLLMKNGAGADPLNPIVRRMKANTSIQSKKRTEENEHDLDHLKWMCSIYWRDGLGPYIPAAMVEAMIRDGAAANRKGKTAAATTLVQPDEIALQYEGPKTLETLYADARFVDRRGVRMGQATVMCVRPRFASWRLSFEVLINEKVFGESDLRAAIDQPTNCLGDYRPRFGRFTVKSWSK